MPISAAAKKLRENPEGDQKKILIQMGVPQDLISEFEDPKFWPQYFIEKAKSDLKLIGVSVDWRRSFMTTDQNPVFDTFVRW